MPDANTAWLLENAAAPIRYHLTKNAGLADELLRNDEARAWMTRLAARAASNEIGPIHGSHDYRMENILGKCAILGLDRNIPALDSAIAFVLAFLERQLHAPEPKTPSFGRLYAHRDCEKVLSCFLPMLGCAENSAVRAVAQKRIDVLYPFTRQKRYDIHVDGSKLAGVKKEWQPFIINPDLYADGHIALPDMHDFILFAGVYDTLSDEDKSKVEMIVGWIFHEGYQSLGRRYGYFYVPGGSYSAKAIIFKVNLADADDDASLLFDCFVLSRFQTARESGWFKAAMAYLEGFRSETGRSVFPARMLTEKPDSFVIFGGHMNVGENRRGKLYKEIISTYWMDRIFTTTYR